MTAGPCLSGPPLCRSSARTHSRVSGSEISDPHELGSGLLLSTKPPPPNELSNNKTLEAHAKARAYEKCHMKGRSTGKSRFGGQRQPQGSLDARTFPEGGRNTK